MDKEKIIQAAISYFNSFIGLQVADHVPNCCIEFSNDIGFVTIQVFQKGTVNEVVLTTREWEHQVLEFITFLGSR